MFSKGYDCMIYFNQRLVTTLLHKTVILYNDPLTTLLHKTVILYNDPSTTLLHKTVILYNDPLTTPPPQNSYTL